MYLTCNIFNGKIAESSSIKNIEIGIKLIKYIYLSYINYNTQNNLVNIYYMS